MALRNQTLAAGTQENSQALSHQVRSLNLKRQKLVLIIRQADPQRSKQTILQPFLRCIRTRTSAPKKFILPTMSLTLTTTSIAADKTGTIWEISTNAS